MRSHDVGSARTDSRAAGPDSSRRFQERVDLRTQLADHGPEGRQLWHQIAREN